MFARIWRGIIRTSVIEGYFRYLRERVLPAYRAADGCRTVWVLGGEQGEFTNVILLSFWESRIALEAFIDPQLQPEAGRDGRETLLAFESTAAVFEVVISGESSSNIDAS
jgi:heme-degrading monooxygenase HmoA